jgi:hypothetical protein
MELQLCPYSGFFLRSVDFITEMKEPLYWGTVNIITAALSLFWFILYNNKSFFCMCCCKQHEVGYQEIILNLYNKSSSVTAVSDNQSLYAMQEGNVFTLWTEVNLKWTELKFCPSPSQSQSHITTDIWVGQLGVRRPSGTCDQICYLLEILC